jgi:site-specific DNA recombinase
MKAAIYSRFSTDRQNESSIIDQERICTEYAERQGWTIFARFEDQGISGAALGNRPGVLKLQEGALARRLDVVLVTDLSRLSRSQGDLSKMIDRLSAKGVRVIGVQDGYDSSRRGHKLQAGLSGIIGEAFRELVKDRTYAALESRAKSQRATGGRAYGYRNGQVDRGEAFIVAEIFGRFADGQSTRAIAADLNRRNILSSGASWKRVERRASGWMGSGIRVIVRNPRYAGRVIWNQSEWRKDPDTGRRTRVMRPASEWITHQDESLRIVSDQLFERAQQRMRVPDAQKPARSGGKPKYLLSGLLRCATCGAHYVGVNGREYGCATHRDGGVCSNEIRVRRDRVEDVVLGGLRTDLLAPDVVQQMAREMEHGFAEYLRTREARSVAVPKELEELAARIERLRQRLRDGDPDMPADELQAAIDRAEGKRRELQDQQPAARQTAKILAMLPKAAEGYRRQIAKGLEGDEREALKARVFLRAAIADGIQLVPDENGGLVAHWNLHTAALLPAGVGTSGSGGRI